LRADVRDQILLVISEPVLSKKILALQMRGTDSWMGEEDGTWSRTFEAFRDQLAPRGSLTCLTSHRRIGLPWPLTALTERHQGAQRLLSCQSCMPMSAIIPLVLSEPVLSRRYWLQVRGVPIHGWGG
jgi:hypothetical protein